MGSTKQCKQQETRTLTFKVFFFISKCWICSALEYKIWNLKLQRKLTWKLHFFCCSYHYTPNTTIFSLLFKEFCFTPGPLHWLLTRILCWQSIDCLLLQHQPPPPLHSSPFPFLFLIMFDWDYFLYLLMFVSY